MSSLTTKMETTEKQVGNYRLTRTRTGWKIKGKGPLANREFTLREAGSGAWDLSAGSTMSSSGRARSRIRCERLEDAIGVADAILYPHAPTEKQHQTLRIAEALHRAIGAMGGGRAHRENLFQSAGYFVDWCDQVVWKDDEGYSHQGIGYWNELTFELVRRYQIELMSGEGRKSPLKRSTVKHYLEPVRMTARFCAANWPSHYHEITRMLRLPKRRFGQGKWKATDGKPAFSFAELHEFARWLETYEHATLLLPGVLLMGYCSLRMQEALAVRWDNIDLKSGTATIEDGDDHEVKTDLSIRRIPLPDFVLKRLRAIEGKPREKVIAYEHDFKAFGKLLKRALRKWRPDIRFAPKDLRATLMNDAQFKIERKDWNELLVRFYCGHAPRNEAEAHYCNKRKAFLTQLWQTEISFKVDELVESCKCPRCMPVAEKPLQSAVVENCQNMSTKPQKGQSPVARVIDIA